MPGTVSFGFYGKLPARGDFVRAGLPRDFTDAWDDWLSQVMQVSRDGAGDAWLPAFLEAPVWRFVLAPGVCGSRAVVGLMMPSVDRAGRYFPLTFAALEQSRPDRNGLVDDTASSVDGWLDGCENAGRDALEQNLQPDAVTAMLAVPAFQPPSPSVTLSEWWTAGSRRLEPARMTLASLPDAARFAAMLGLAAETQPPVQG